MLTYIILHNSYNKHCYILLIKNIYTKWSKIDDKKKIDFKYLSTRILDLQVDFLDTTMSYTKKFHSIFFICTTITNHSVYTYVISI